MKDFTPAHGVYPTLITPFTDDLEVDWGAYERLIEWHVERGVTGLFIVCGSSEYFFLKEEEALRMGRTAVKAVGGRAFVLAGSTFHKTREQNIELTKKMADTGVDGCFLTTHPDLPAEDDVQLDYFMGIHDAVDCPVYAYEQPVGPGYKFSPAAMKVLADSERFIAIKDTSTDETAPAAQEIAKLKPKVEAAGGGIKLMQAITTFLYQSMEIGFTGATATACNIAPRLFVRFYELWQNGERGKAAALGKVLGRIDIMMESYGYPASAKIIVGMLGCEFGPKCRIGDFDFTPERMQILDDLIEIIQRAESEFGVR